MDTAGPVELTVPYLPLLGMLAANTCGCPFSAALLLQRIAISQTEDSRSKKLGHAPALDSDRLMALKAQPTSFKVETAVQSSLSIDSGSSQLSERPFSCLALSLPCLLYLNQSPFS